MTFSFLTYSVEKKFPEFINHRYFVPKELKQSLNGVLDTDRIRNKKQNCSLNSSYEYVPGTYFTNYIS